MNNKELLSIGIVDSKLFKDIMYFVKKQYSDKHNMYVVKKQYSDKHNIMKFVRKNNNQIISYNEFKSLIEYLIFQIMKEYLKDTEYENEHCSSIVKNTGIYSGYFVYINNIIAINEYIIKNLYYKGDILGLLTILHELNHFKMKYDIMLGQTDENINRVLKENLLRLCIDSYYDDNYKFISEEVYADIQACNDLLKIIDMFEMKVRKKDLMEIKTQLEYYKIKYEYYKREVKGLDIVGSIKFNELFDTLILDHPEWLSYSQIASEYGKRLAYSKFN